MSEKTITQVYPRRQLPKESPSATRVAFAACRVLLLITAAGLALSFLLTGTWTWNIKPPSWNKLKSQYLSEEKLFTPQQLAQYDGSDPNKPVYLAVLGNVYDVTSGRETYGPKGSYSFFAGKDASRAYVTGCFETHLIPDTRGLTESQMAEIKNWRDFYHKHDRYFYVGRVQNPPIDPDSPIPADCKST